MLTRRAMAHYMLCGSAVATMLYLGMSTGTSKLEAAPTLDTLSGCVPAWEVVTSPRPGRVNAFYGLAVVTANDIWSVGYYSLNFPNAPRQTLTEHWDGSSWSQVPSPDIGTGNNAFLSVSAVSSTDVWAAGSYEDGGYRTLLAHWDGATWTQVASPSPGTGSSFLQGVSAVSSTDVWAVGDYNYPSSQTLVLHWDGTAWTQVSSPSPSGNGILTGVDFNTSVDGWASGFYYEGGYAKTLVLHWDGSTWTQTPSPNPSQGADNALQAIAVISPNDVWAVGEKQAGTNYETLTLHWDGVQWTYVPGPTGPYLGRLYAVSGASANDVWAVGAIATSDTQVWLLHWDGSAWTMLPGADPGTSDTHLYGVAAFSSSNVWTVGETSTTSKGGVTLIERYAGACSTPTPTQTQTKSPTAAPSATSTSTPTITFTNTPTGTPVSTLSATSTGSSTAISTLTSTPVVSTATTTSTFVATSTATSTPTVCPITFSDVLPDSAFYTFIRCLVCRGIISGYSDGTFRPQNDITRGQIAKMVSNAAGFQEDPGPKVYEDVDSTNPFYQWINRLSNRGYMGGYPCGTLPEEPCNPPDNRPYFRPLANATRGQLAKIVANAAGVAGTPAGQFYADVLEDNPFYLWIMRLTDLGVMSGYNCGGPNEPCDEEQRPYFRPYNNVTRGQASKIVANTFFPDCRTPVTLRSP